MKIDDSEHKYLEGNPYQGMKLRLYRLGSFVYLRYQVSTV